MKTGRANAHLETLETEVKRWLERPPYTIKEWDDLKKWHYCQIDVHPINKDVPLLVGDFVCCLRSALDQLAWALAHLDAERKFTRSEERQIHFLIFGTNDPTYAKRRLLFPSTVAEVFDTLQPYNRGDAYRDDPLWQLNELWTLDKHIMIPSNCQTVEVKFPIKIPGIEWLGHSNNRITVRFPMAVAWLRPAHLQPRITPQILFGEYMGTFEVSVPRLREIYHFVTDEVVPRFAKFFP